MVGKKVSNRLTDHMAVIKVQIMMTSVRTRVSLFRSLFAFRIY